MMLRATGNVSFICFFKQKTAYEMRISDWSSDVCSTDLPRGSGWIRRHLARAGAQLGRVLPDGDGVQIDDTVDALEFVLQGHPVADRPEIVAEMQVAGGLDAREDAVHDRCFSRIECGQELSPRDANPVKGGGFGRQPHAS